MIAVIHSRDIHNNKVLPNYAKVINFYLKVIVKKLIT